MRRLGIAGIVATVLLVSACGSDSDEPATAPGGAAPAQTQAKPPAPADTNPAVPLRLTPEGLLATPATAPPALHPPAVSAAPLPPQQPTDDAPPSEAEVRALYEGIMYTYAFDACGLPLIGQTARKDIEEKIEACPNLPLRKDAFRTIYHRAIEFAEEDPQKTRAGASRACPDKRDFLRRVMSHAGELQFDDAQPLDCGLLSTSPPGPPPAGPSAGPADPLKAQKPF